MSEESPTQFELERYAYHDEIMAALKQRHEWTRKQIVHRAGMAMTLAGVAFARSLSSTLLGHPGGPVGVLLPAVALSATSIALSLRNKPVRWYRQWNAAHPQMGQYLAPDLTD